MATFIGQEHAKKFDSESYKNLVKENSGTELSTEGIIAGINSVWENLNNQKDNPLDTLKKSPFYINGK